MIAQMLRDFSERLKTTAIPVNVIGAEAEAIATAADAEETKSAAMLAELDARKIELAALLRECDDAKQERDELQKALAEHQNESADRSSKKK